MTLYSDTAQRASTGDLINFSTLTKRNSEKRDNVSNGYNNNYYNNYPGARACVRVREGMTAEMDEMRDLYDLYCDAFGRDRVAAIVRREMAAAIEAGADPSLIVYAIEMAEAAPSPSWAYARAVMRKCMADSCRTYEDCEARAERVRARGSERKQPSSNNKIPQYKQRDLTDDDFAQGFYVDVMQRGRDRDQH